MCSVLNAGRQGDGFSSTITNIRPENETVYYCEVFISRSIGTTKVKGTGTTVTLYSEASSIRIRRPLQLASGSESVLTCKASGFYPRNVLAQWFHGDAPAPPGSVKDVVAAASDGTFSLLSSYAFRARAHDHGVRCRCLVSHPTWARGRSANVTLDVGYGPGFVNVTSDPGPVTQGSLLLPAGSPLSFSCSADGNPRPETRWLGGNVTARHVGGTLQLAAVREEDGGTYWCVAKNLYGEKNASITLLVSQSQTSPGSLRLLALCVLGAVLMIFVFSLVCLLTKRMNRSPAHAQTLSDSRSEGALPPLSESQGASPDPIYSVLELSSKRARQREPVPHTVDESQPIYAEVKFPLAPRNRNIMEATESTIYSTVIFRNA
ncbi:cell adhesion molecule 2-like isoform X2 [Anguilla anguilla]|uniref:cell adhesion molecule 2-like isoform X2 n=1 Tax=Anguilla anguilla TaxID=7936 RepID=UPI0015AF1893|nr:cell adhesion molecule 2-like isoform X2 [Anguilla anguilla]